MIDKKLYYESEIIYHTLPAAPDFQPPTRQPMSRKHKLRLERQHKRAAQRAPAAQP